MKTACFLDTNVLIYALAGKSDEPRKYAIASELLRTADVRLSAQVLAEFAAVAMRRFQNVVAADELDAWLTMLARFPCIPIDAEVVRSGASNARKYRISYFDGAIIAAAGRAGAEVLYTEDLNSGQKFGRVQAINPFL